MTKERFEICVARLFAHEGGYVDHPEDPGGATNLGITLKTLADWRRVDPWWSLGKAEVRELTQREAEEIYHARYWHPAGAERMPAGLDEAVFDFAVNSGTARAIKTLQGILGVVRDGIAGPLTLAAIQHWCVQRAPSDLVDALCAARLSFLRGLPGFATFGNGWTRRVEAVRRAALEDAETETNQSNENEVRKMDILSGYRTYVVAAAMLIAGLAQALGIELPGFDTQSALHLVTEALAIIFLRRGLKSDGGGSTA